MRWVCEMPNTHGGPNRGQGRKLKPTETKFKKRMFSLPPETVDKLDQWAVEEDGNKSDLVARLLNWYFEGGDTCL